MKKNLLLTLASLMAVFGFSQTAGNFTCNDCSGNNHDLFTELNSGKVIVIAWVMPCGACISGALAGYTQVQGFQSSNPGTVLFYLADDVANTSCSSLTSWANTNGMSGANAVFSNSTVNMSPYGTAGMPKVVVLGGSNHAVFYNQNGSAITQSGIQSAIAAAIAANTAGINVESNFSSMELYPNPSNSSSKLALKLVKATQVKSEVQNQLGQKVAEVLNSNLRQGDNTVKIDLTELANGTYFISCSDGEVSKKLKLIVLR